MTDGQKDTPLRRDGPGRPEVTLVLAHGAGAGMDSPFMAFMAEQLGAAGLGVLRFEFPYMLRRRQTGRRSPPDRMPRLMDAFREVTSACQGPLVIGGKSMGGRVASMLADELGVLGLVCFGYPFHPAGRPDRLRVDHLHDLTTPALVIQGTRDALGSRDEVAGYGLPPDIELLWLEDGDHSFKPRKKSGFTVDQHWQTAARAVAEWISGLPRPS